MRTGESHYVRYYNKLCPFTKLATSSLFSLVTVLALQLSPGGQIPVSVAAWYHKDEPTFTDCLALVRQHIWRARYLVNSAAEAEFVQFPREVFELLLTGLPLAA
jgi:hypothetical protein